MSNETTNFTYTHRGEVYTFAESFAKCRQPGWLRHNRHREGIDLYFTILETVAGDEFLAVVDEMTEDEFKDLLLKIDEAMGADLGESSASSR